MKRHQTSSFKFVLTVLVVGFASNVSAQVDDTQTRVANPLDAVELDKMTVMGEKLTREQILSLRLIKIGLQNHRSSRAEDANKIVCWFDAPTGTHMQHLYCGANWALDSIRQESMGALFRFGRAAGQQSVGLPTAGAGRPNARENYYVSSQQVSPAFVEIVMQQLGPVALNREIVDRAMQGEEMPDNVPTEAELERFMVAYAAVKAIRAEYDPRIAKLDSEARKSMQKEADASMAQAIDQAGLTVDRYNAISDMAEEYTTLRNYLAKRLASNE